MFASIINLCLFKSTHLHHHCSVNRKTDLQIPANKRVPVLSKSIKGLRNGKKKKRMSELWQSLKKLTAVSKLAQPPACQSSRPALAALSAATVPCSP